ncbi:DUF1493 family protein [Citrobacter freundii]|jgi:hypothetical protein|uniref:DUF1493 family protein n=1 Tax=Citrobacter freundii TaxID=546 RepID=UPI0015EA58BE|nr:DUF1493 family protein [Citrobacter freundii]QMB07288.1 DUF1493 family protein [Citrobacter freundii]
MSIQDDVLKLFREEIPGFLDENWKEVPLELDSELFDAPGDDLHSALERYEKEFKVDLSCVNWKPYYPWHNLPLFTRWFKAKREEVEATRLPLTVRMFAESAEAGKWLFEIWTNNKLEDA